MDVLVIPLLTGCEDFPDDDLGHDGDDGEEASRQDSPDDKDQMTIQDNPGGDQPRNEVQRQMPTSARYSDVPGGDQPNKFAKKCKEVQWPVTTPVTVPDNEVSSRANQATHSPMRSVSQYATTSNIESGVPELKKMDVDQARLQRRNPSRANLSQILKIKLLLETPRCQSSDSPQTHGLSYKMSTPRIPPSCSLVAPVCRLCIAATICRNAKVQQYCFLTHEGPVRKLTSDRRSDKLVSQPLTILEDSHDPSPQEVERRHRGQDSLL